MIETIPAALDGQRVDRVVAMVLGCTRTAAAGLVDGGSVRIGNEVIGQRSRRVRTGDVIEVEQNELVAPSPPEADADVAVQVIYEDEAVVVVDKPAGLVVHPGAGNESKTLVNGLLARFPDLAGAGDPARPGIVHRLDKDTSGLLMVARHADAYEALVAQLTAREPTRRYRALVWGEFETSNGVIDASIGRSRRDPTRMAVSAQGRPARTGYRVQQRWDQPAVSLLECTLETGRTHQIRVHLASIDHPIVGDGRYGGNRSALVLDRPWLHAVALEFRHPMSGEPLRFTSEPSTELLAMLDGLGPALDG